MTRPFSLKAEYFFHYADGGKTIYLIEKRFGHEGYTAWYKILEMLTATENHFLNFGNAHEIEYFCDKANIKKDRVLVIMGYFGELGGIDGELWGRGIVWSQHLVDSFKRLYHDRKRECPNKPNLNDYKVMPGIIGENPRNSGASEVKGSEVKGSEENKLSGPETVPDPVCVEIFDKLITKVKGYRPNHKLGNRDKDLKTIGLMLTADKRPPARVLELLAWYPIGRQYIPQIFSAKSLREKFDNLEEAQRRSIGTARPKFGSTIPTLPRRDL